MKKDPIGALIVLLVIAVLSVFVWMTRHPDSELLARAEEWPVIGRVVSSFRDHYIAMPSPEPEVDDAEVGEAAAQPSVVMRPGTVEAEVSHLPHGSVWVKKGTRLHEMADPRSEVAGTAETFTNLPVVDRDGDWYQVIFRGRPAWVSLPGYGEGSSPPLGREPEAPRPLPGKVADPELLELAVEFLQLEPEPSRLGDYALMTDLDDQQLLQRLEVVAGAVEPAYSQRYGLSPVDRPRETIVVYRAQRDYRRLQNSLERLVGLSAVGLVSRGVVAIFVGKRDREEISSTLVHELTHLLNRRALGPALPPWLDEGIAGDLGYSAISEAGVLDPTRLAGSSPDLGSVRILRGGRAAALEMKRALAGERLVPLSVLLRLDWRSFVDPDRELDYPQSAFFVRFLLISDSELRDGFRRYLEGIAEGGSATPETLLACLRLSWSELEEEFQRWLPAELAQLLEEESPSGGEE